MATVDGSREESERRLRPPNICLMLAEGRGLFEFNSSLLLLPLLMRAPRGDGHPVLTLPGFLASDLSMAPMRRYLKALGYDTYAWSLGRNVGGVGRMRQSLRDLLRRISDSTGRKVSIIGWSLGGIYAREVAKCRPDLVEKVVTLGTPFSGDMRANNVWRIYELVAGHPVDDPPLDIDIAAKPPVPTLAIWSRRDGAIAPAAARGKEGERDRAVEIDSTHMGYAVSKHSFPQIIDAIRAF